MTSTVSSGWETVPCIFGYSCKQMRSSCVNLHVPSHVEAFSEVGHSRPLRKTRRCKHGSKCRRTDEECVDLHPKESPLCLFCWGQQSVDHQTCPLCKGSGTFDLASAIERNRIGNTADVSEECNGEKEEEESVTTRHVSRSKVPKRRQGPCIWGFTCRRIQDCPFAHEREHKKAFLKFKQPRKVRKAQPCRNGTKCTKPRDTCPYLHGKEAPMCLYCWRKGTVSGNTCRLCHGEGVYDTMAARERIRSAADS